jgi:putative ABC transport system ATP-binding protein
MPDGILDLQLSAPAVSLRGVGKVYAAGRGSLVALAAVDLDLHAGEVAALMGPSGSGKTTLLSIVGGILTPTAGEVWIGGREIARLSEAERSRTRLAHIGFVFQGYNLFPSLTARQNVEISLELKGTKRRQRATAANALLEQVALSDKADTYPADLSGGQKQRVAIARALAGSPEIILADEPTAALDSVTGRRIMALFRDLARVQKRAVVIVTHDSRLLDFADRVIAVDDGRVTEERVHRPSADAGTAALTAALIRRPRSFEPAEVEQSP